jgi:hypothetical protein
VLLHSTDASAAELLKICLNAIREEWLRAEDRAIVAGEAKDCFAKMAAECGFLRRGGPIAVCERVWLRMQATGESLVVVERKIPNKFGPEEQYPTGWLYDGCIEHPFKAMAYLGAIFAARRAAELHQTAVVDGNEDMPGLQPPSPTDHATAKGAGAPSQPPRSSAISLLDTANTPVIPTAEEKQTPDTAGESTEVPENGNDSDFKSETARTAALGAYTHHWTTDEWTCSEASLARTAHVDPADLSKWKKGLLPSESGKAARIEAALKDDTPPTRAPKAPGDT